VVPASNPHKLHINREAFAAAVRRSSVISSDKDPPGAGRADRGQADGAHHQPRTWRGRRGGARDWSGPDLSTAFNARYLLDTFAAMGGADIEVRLADPGSPALFINPADMAAQWVVMPMRT
jgi:DNA polymerase-3 subunit beta